MFRVSYLTHASGGNRYVNSLQPSEALVLADLPFSYEEPGQSRTPKNRAPSYNRLLQRLYAMLSFSCSCFPSFTGSSYLPLMKVFVLLLVVIRRIPEHKL
jgi:hypothetical protein